jgi:hypothetical protein
MGHSYVTFTSHKLQAGEQWCGNWHQNKTVTIVIVAAIDEGMDAYVYAHIQPNPKCFFLKGF